MDKLLKILPAALFAWLMAGCAPADEGPDPNGRSQLQRWIEQTLGNEYLWNEDVASKPHDYKRGYEDFFYSLLSTDRSDGKHDMNSNYFYSYIIEKGAASRAEESPVTEKSLGLECVITLSFPNEQTNMFNIYAIVTFVYEGSPAWNAGLRRGSHIYKVDGEEFNIQNYGDLFYKLWPKSASGLDVVARELAWCSQEQTGTKEGVPVASRFDEQSAKIEPAMVEANPVYDYKIFENEGNKTAYLAYNAFEYGGDGHLYDDKLKEVFNEFKTAGATDLVLDLRYNRGGYVSSCQLLSSMIVSEGKLGAPYQQEMFNALKNPRGRMLNFLTEAEMSGVSYGQAPGTNLNLSRLFVLVTATSASASEALIHCLRGAGTTVYLIGMPTEGKNVGMTLFDSDDSEIEVGAGSYEMWPVTFYIQDGNGVGYSNEGFGPATYDLFTLYDETLDVAWLPLGDENEPMLKMALNHINGTAPLGSGTAVRSAAPAAELLRPLPLRDTGMKEER